MGDLSPHFSKIEFRCKCPRKHLEPFPLELELVQVLERVRARAGRPLPILSGYRCPAHNRSIGGAPKSQHLLGRAADLEVGMVSVEAAIGAGARGIGTRRGWVVHLDVRPGQLVIFPD